MFLNNNYKQEFTYIYYIDIILIYIYIFLWCHIAIHGLKLTQTHDTLQQFNISK